MRVALGIVTVATAALVAPSSVLAVSSVAPAPVVGSGTINVPLLTVRAAPRHDARVVARLSEFRPQDYRPRYVLAVAAMRGKTGKASWYKITVPGRPNGRTGWVRAGHVTIRAVPWQVVVYRGSRLVQVWKGKELVNTARVAIGAPGMETPTGLYFVTVRFKPVQVPFLGELRVRDERLLQALGVAGRRRRRRPRNNGTGAARTGRLTRVRSHLQSDCRLPARPHPAGDPVRSSRADPQLRTGCWLRTRTAQVDCRQACAAHPSCRSGA